MAERAERAPARWWLLSLPIAAMTAALALGYLWNADFWWYLGSGRAILDNGGAIPEAEPFLETGGEVVGWVAHSWLWTVIVAALDRLAGLEAVVVFHAAVAVALVALLYTVARTDRWGLLNAGAALLFVAAMGPRLTGKAEMASWLLLAVFFRLFERGGAFGWRRVALLAALQVLWANLHGGYPLGIFVALCYALAPPVEDRLRRRFPRRLAPPPPAGERPPLWLPVLLLAVALADPRMAAERLAPFAFVLGAESVQPVGETGTMLIAEWRSPFDAQLGSTRHLPIYLLSVAVGAAGLLARRRLSLARLAVFVGFAALGASAVRHLGGFALAAGLVALANVADGIAERRGQPGRGRRGKGGGRRRARGGARRWAPAAAAAGVAILALAAAASLWAGRTGFEAGQGEGRFFNVRPPIAAPGAAEYLLAHGAAGPIFNDYQLGGYLGPRLHPRHRVFVDPRVLDPAVVVRYTRIVGSAAEWRRAERERGFRTVVLGHFSRTLSAPLGAALAADPAWRLVYFDPLAVVYAKDQPRLPVEVRPWRPPERPGGEARVPYPGAGGEAGPAGRLRRWLLDDSPSNYLVEYLANLGRLGRIDDLRAVASAALATAPDHPLLLRQRCAAHLASGAPAAARDDCRRAYELRPDDPQIVSLYALVLTRAGEAGHAAFVLDEALRRHPGDPALTAQRRQLRGPRAP